MIKSKSKKMPVSALDDLRKIREQIDREYGGDWDQHIAESKRVTELYRKNLGLRPAKSASRKNARRTAGG